MWYIHYNLWANIGILLSLKLIVYIRVHSLGCTFYGFDKHIITSIHHYGIIQNSFTALKIYSSLSPSSWTLGPLFTVSIDFSHSNKCVVVSRCFNLQFCNDIWYWACFHVLISHWYIFLVRFYSEHLPTFKLGHFLIVAF